MFIALSVLFPIVFHAVGLGAVFLPIFLPIAASIFFLPMVFVTAVAVLSPVLSFLFTGMPPISPPILYIMICELLVLVMVSKFLLNRSRLGIFWVLLFGLTASRIVLFVLVTGFAALLRLPEQFTSVIWIARGVPGVIMILIVVPVLVQRISNHSIFANRKSLEIFET